MHLFYSLRHPELDCISSYLARCIWTASQTFGVSWTLCWEQDKTQSVLVSNSSFIYSYNYNDWFSLYNIQRHSTISKYIKVMLAIMQFSSGDYMLSSKRHPVFSLSLRHHPYFCPLVTTVTHHSLNAVWRVLLSRACFFFWPLSASWLASVIPSLSNCTPSQLALEHQAPFLFLVPKLVLYIFICIL